MFSAPVVGAEAVVGYGIPDITAGSMLNVNAPEFIPPAVKKLHSWRSVEVDEESCQFTLTRDDIIDLHGN